MRDIILKFLKGNNSGRRIDMSDILKPFDKERKLIGQVLNELKGDKLIEIDDGFRQVSSTSGGQHRPLRECNLKARLTPLGETYCKEHLINFDNMTDGEKIQKILEYTINKKPDQFDWRLDELILAFDNSLNEYEVQYLCQQLIDNGDVVNCIAKDGFSIRINEKSKSVFYGKKYLKQFDATIPISIAIEQLQNIQSSVINAPVTQSRDDLSSSNTITKTINPPTPADIKQKPNTWTLSNISFNLIVGIIVAVVGGIIVLIYWEKIRHFFE